MPRPDKRKFQSARAQQCGGLFMTLPPITGRGHPRIAEARGRKAAGSVFSVPEGHDTPATDAPIATAAVTPLLALQAEGGPQIAPAHTLAQVASGAIRNLGRLQLALLRADPIPDDLLETLSEAAAHIAQADDALATEWRPLLMRIRVELARHGPDPATPSRR